MRHKKQGRKLGRSASHRQALRRNMASALLRRERVVTTPQKAKEVRRFVERLITMARRAQAFKDTGDPADRARYVHYYRLALQRLQDKKMVQKLFGEGEWREQECLGQRFVDRPGGYTRIVRLGGTRIGVPVGTTVSAVPEFTYELNGQERTLRLTGNRLGDNAEQCIFELVREPMEAPEPEQLAPAIKLSDDEEPGEEADESAEQ